MEKHRKILVMTFFLFGIGSALYAVFIFKNLGIQGADLRFVVLGTLQALLYISASIATLKSYSWQSYLGIPAAIISLTNIPIGLVAGIYYLWFYKKAIAPNMRHKGTPKQMEAMYFGVSALIRLLYFSFILYVLIIHFRDGIEKGIRLGIGQNEFFLSIILIIVFLGLIVPCLIPLKKLLWPGNILSKLIYFDIGVFLAFSLTLFIGAVI